MVGVRATVLAATLVAAACMQAGVHTVESYAGAALPP
jgi:hypothetical protein